MTSPASSADPAEIAKFEALAHRFWDSEGEFKPLHRLNPVRADYVAARSRLAYVTALAGKAVELLMMPFK